MRRGVRSSLSNSKHADAIGFEAGKGFGSYSVKFVTRSNRELERVDVHTPSPVCGRNNVIAAALTIPTTMR